MGSVRSVSLTLPAAAVVHPAGRLQCKRVPLTSRSVVGVPVAAGSFFRLVAETPGIEAATRVELLEALHLQDLEKSKLELELELEKALHLQDLEKSKVELELELQKSKLELELELEKALHLQDLELEKSKVELERKSKQNLELELELEKSKEVFGLQLALRDKNTVLVEAKTRLAALENCLNARGMVELVEDEFRKHGLKSSNRSENWANALSMEEFVELRNCIYSCTALNVHDEAAAGRAVAALYQELSLRAGHGHPSTEEWVGSGEVLDIDYAKLSPARGRLVACLAYFLGIRHKLNGRITSPGLDGMDGAEVYAGSFQSSGDAHDIDMLGEEPGSG
jgi:hypothetical protein